MADGSVTGRWVYGFGGGKADGDASMKNLLGGKGANLAEMSSLGLPVPPGFTITTEACTRARARRATSTADRRPAPTAAAMPHTCSRSNSLI